MNKRTLSCAPSASSSRFSCAFATYEPAHVAEIMVLDISLLDAERGALQVENIVNFELASLLRARTCRSLNQMHGERT